MNLRLCSTEVKDCGDSRLGRTRRTRRLRQQCALGRERIQAADRDAVGWIGLCCESALVIDDNGGLDDSGHRGGEANGGAGE